MVFDGLPCKNYSLHLKSKFMFIQVFPNLCFIFNRPNYWFSIRYKAYVSILPSMLHRGQKGKNYPTNLAVCMNERVKCILQNINSYQIGRPFAIIPRCPKRIEYKLQIELKSA